jgi:HSP20 family protein
LPETLGRKMNDLAREMEQVLNISDEAEKSLQQPARRYVRDTKAMFRTSADILEVPDSYIFVLDMPGLEANNIKVKVDNNILHIAGKKKKNKQLNPEVKVIRMERRKARYMRKFSLPGDSNVEDIKATYKDGVLTVTVGKRQPSDAEKPKSVTIPIS